MDIKVLGSGCKKCLALARNVQTAADTLGIDAEIKKVTDIVDIARYGVMTTPALMIDEKIVSTGKVLSAAEIEQLLQK